MDEKLPPVCATMSDVDDHRGGTVSGPTMLDREAIAQLCSRYGVRRLVVFGSVLTDRFDPANSDVDLIVEFGDEVASGFDSYFGLKEGLEELFGRPVDLVMPRALANPYFAATLRARSEELYAV